MFCRRGRWKSISVAVTQSCCGQTHHVIFFPQKCHNLKSVVFSFLKNLRMLSIFLRRDLFCCSSPARSPGAVEQDIIMMNHVYKERFPKVRLTVFVGSRLQGKRVRQVIVFGEYLMSYVMFHLPEILCLRLRLQRQSAVGCVLCIRCIYYLL